jgi:hypothetical protein
MPKDSISMRSNNLNMPNVDAGTSLRRLSASTMPEWYHFDSQTWSSTPKSEPSSVDTTVWGWLHMPHGQHINVLKRFLHILLGCGKQFEVAVSLKHETMTSFCPPKWPSTSKFEPSSMDITVWGCFLYVHVQHINVLKHFIYTLYGYRKQFDVAISLNHEAKMLSFWLNKHKWPRTPKSEEPSSVGITVWGWLHMPHGHHINVLKQFLHI